VRSRFSTVVPETTSATAPARYQLSPLRRATSARSPSMLPGNTTVSSHTVGSAANTLRCSDPTGKTSRNWSGLPTQCCTGEGINTPRASWCAKVVPFSLLEDKMPGV
jgi:hypothetical protein